MANGTCNMRAKPYVITRTLTPGTVDTVRPSTVYYSIDSTQLRFKREAMEDFEDVNNIKLDSTVHSKTKIKQISHRNNPNAWLDPNDTLNHYRSGRVQLTDSINMFDIASKELRNLPAVGNYVMLEMDYKCDKDFLVGMYINSPQSGIMVIPLNEKMLRLTKLNDGTLKREEFGDCKFVPMLLIGRDRGYGKSSDVCQHKLQQEQYRE